VRKKELRFAVGEPGDQLSPVCKIWNRKNDVYLSFRLFGGIVKVSMHASGVWTIAAPSESGIEIKPGNRRLKTWYRPSEFQPGWTWGPQIAVPRLTQTDHAKIDEGQSKIVEWFPKPPPNTRGQFAVIFAAPEKVPEHIAEISKEGDAYMTEYLELNNLEKVFIRYSIEPLSEADQSNMTYYQSEADKCIEANKDGEVFGFLASFMQGGDVPCSYVFKWATPPKS
jgi:hypothetical protein